MNQRSRYLFKNMGILTISNFASKILVLLLVPLYTSTLSTVEYGTYDLVVSTVTLLLPLLTLNIIDAMMRFLMDKSYVEKEIVSIGIKYVFLSIYIVGLMLFIVHCLNIFPALAGLKGYLFFYFLAYVLNQFFIQLAKGLERVQDMGIAGVLGTIVMLGANILFLLVFKAGLAGFFIANILAQAIPVLYYFIRLRFWTYLARISRNKKLEKEMLIYCLPLICTTLGWWINSASDKYVVTFICGLAANGILGVSYKVPGMINTLHGIFTQAWQISAIKEYGGNDTSVFYGKCFSYVNLITSAACSWAIILSKPLAHFLYANDFYVAWQYVPFLLVSCVLNGSSGFIGPILSAQKDSKSMAMSAVYGASVNLVLNIVLVYFIGVQGATIATVVSSFIIYYVRKKAVGNELKVENYWKILLTWGLLAVQAAMEIYFSAWYAEIGLMVVLLVLNWSILAEVAGMFIKKKYRY